MAAIGALRKRAGFVIIFIGISMVLFILTSYFESSGNLFGPDSVVGNVKGEEIQYQDFINKVKKLEDDYKRNQEEIDEEKRFQISEEVWNKTILKIIMDDEPFIFPSLKSV